VVKFLLENDAEINQSCAVGQTALHYAAENGHAQLLPLLVDNGALINIVNNNDSSPLLNSALDGFTEVVQKLLECGANPNLAREQDGVSPLFIAAKYNRVAIVELLVKHGATVNYECDEDGATALFIAAQRGHFDVVKFLLSQKAKINLSRRTDDLTPLFSAALEGHEKTVELLLEEGANPDLCCNLNGDTPLHAAISKGNVSIVKLLLDKNARLDYDNYAGVTPLELARKRGYEGIVSLIKDKMLTNFVEKPKKTESQSSNSLFSFFGYKPKFYTDDQYNEAAKAYLSVIRGEADSHTLTEHEEVLKAGELGRIYFR